MSEIENYKIEIRTPRTESHLEAVAHATGMLKEMYQDSYVEEVRSVDYKGLVRLIIKTKYEPIEGPHINFVQEMEEL